MLVLPFRAVQSKILMALATALLLTACTKDMGKNEQPESSALSLMGKANQAQKFNTFYGPQVQVGDGKARSFIIISHAGVPMELGVEMTSGSMTGLPESQHLSAFTLPLHQKALDATPFNHIVVNWNEHGHPPFHLFSESHFDFHFYTISEAAQMAIPAYTPNSAHDILPAPAYRPAGYVPGPGGEAMMGKHWSDITNPVNPGTFTHTMIYGSYNGSIIFLEPMITRAFLQSGSSVTKAFGQPAQYAETGTYYPQDYNIRMEGSKHYVTLSRFALR